VLGRQVYFILTGLLLVVAAALMVFKRTADTVETRRVQLFPATAVGAESDSFRDLLVSVAACSGHPCLSPSAGLHPNARLRFHRRSSSSFILWNSVVGLAGVLAPARFSIRSGLSPESSSALSLADTGCQKVPHDTVLRSFLCLLLRPSFR
jgi:hypothetical protein